MGQETIRKCDLTFERMEDGTYKCLELAVFPARFEEYWGAARIREEIEKFLRKLRKACGTGSECFDRACSTISVDGLSLYQQLMFWMSDWCDYHPDLCRIEPSYRDQLVYEVLHALFIPVLPERVLSNTLELMKIAGFALNGEHFGFLFVDENWEARRIITDTQLFELQNVSGYTYFDITAAGKPIARSCCRQGGKRAFFDGVRLMLHEQLTTCRPQTKMIRDGYMIESTGGTIVNGKLYKYYEDIYWPDNITEAPVESYDFSKIETYATRKLVRCSSGRVCIEGGSALFDGKSIMPHVSFHPCEIWLDGAGFSLCYPSAFEQDGKSQCPYSLLNYGGI